jgi:ABC-2 type transport system permease protein
VTPSSVAGRELLEFGQRRRALVIKLGFPLAVGAPLLLSSAPPFYAAMALTMVIAVTGALGSGAVLTRERAAGLLLRYRLLPQPAGLLVLERLAAAAAIDLLQFLPVLGLLALRHPGGARWWGPLLLATAAVLLAGNVLGAFASTLSRSPGEVMLFTLLPLLPAFYLAGLFVPPHGTLASLVAELLPFSWLHAALGAALGASPEAPAWQVAAASALFLALAAYAAHEIGRRVLETD